MDYFATALTKIYDVTVMVPRWLLLLISGSLASAIVNLMHNSPSLWSKSTPKPKPGTEGKAKPPTSENPLPSESSKPEVKASGSGTSKSGASKRKGGKK